jgi:DNA-binding NarL/FixJ family response regulator
MISEAPTSDLTPHQVRLREMFVEGHHYKSASAELGVTVNTIAFHVQQVYSKLQFILVTKLKGFGIGFVRPDTLTVTWRKCQ